MRGHGLLWLVVIAPGLASPVLAAAEIYKWIGPDGVTHYSEAAPAPELPVVETLELGDVDYPPPAARDYRRVLEVARHLEAGRLERERLRLERQRLRQQQARAAARDQREYAESTRYYPVYPYYHHYLRKYPRHRPVPAPYQERYDHHRPRGDIETRVPGMSSR